MGTYTTSTGEKYTQKQIDRKIREAKKEKIRRFMEKHGYLFCEDCRSNDCIPVECSHDIPIDKCKKMGKLELAWDVNNISLAGRDCHRIKDGLNIAKSKIK